MTGPANTSNSITSHFAALMERVEAIICRLDKLERLLEDSERARGEFRLNYERAHAVLEGEVKAAHRRIDDHEAMLKTQHDEIKAITKLAGEIRVMLAVGGMVGTAVILWVVAQLLGGI